MTVTTRITLTREEVEEYRRTWKECNDGDISDEEIKDSYWEMFWADLRDYIIDTDVEIEIV